MANEINVQATLTVQRFTPAMQGSGNLNINQTGTHGIANVQNIGYAADESLNLVDVATLGYLFVKNLDTTNYVELSRNTGGSFAGYRFAKLKAGEFCLVLLPSCLPYEKSDDRVLAQGTCTPSVRALVRRRPDHCSQRR